MKYKFVASSKQVFLFALVIAIACTQSFAQDTTAAKKWNFLLEPYLLFPNMQGSVGVGTLPDAALDVNAKSYIQPFQTGRLAIF